MANPDVIMRVSVDSSGFSELLDLVAAATRLLDVVKSSPSRLTGPGGEACPLGSFVDAAFWDAIEAVARAVDGIEARPLSIGFLTVDRDSPGGRQEQARGARARSAQMAREKAQGPGPHTRRGDDWDPPDPMGE